VDEQPAAHKKPKQHTVRIADIKELEGLKGASLKAQMKAWGVAARNFFQRVVLRFFHWKEATVFWIWL